jgi:hypothetical protein
MAKIRSIHPGLFIDDAFMELSIPARLLLIGIWTQCDDRGIFEWRPRSLKAAIFPGDTIDVGPLLHELEREEFVKPFDGNGKEYGAARNFRRYQSPKRCTYRHPFPAWVPSYVAFKGSDEEAATPSEHPHGTTAAPSEPPHGPRGVGVGTGMGVGTGSTSKTNIESLERVPSTTCEAKTLSQTIIDKVLKEKKPGTALPATWVPSDKLCEAMSRDYGMTDADLQAEVPAFHALNVERGTLSADWDSTFRLFCKRWKEHRDRQAPAGIEVSRSAAPWQPTEQDWSNQIARWARNNSNWSRHFGPEPGMSGCKCPPEILERHGIDPKTGMRATPQ